MTGAAPNSIAVLLAFNLMTMHASIAGTLPIIDKYIAWRGGSAFTNLQAIAQSGSFSDGGVSGPAAIVTTAGGTRKTLRYGGFKTVLAVSGDQGFYTNLAGQRLPLAPIEVEYARRDAALLLYSAFAGASVSAAGVQVVNGRPWNVARVSGDGDARYDFLIGDNGALYGVRIKRNGGTEMELYRDWRMVDGVRLPFEMHDSGDAGLGVIQDDTTDFTVKSMTLNAPVASDAFAPPPNRMAVSFDDGESSGWIPFAFSDYAIFLNISVNGHKVQAILDSGAGTTVIDTHAAIGLGVHASGRFLTQGQGGSANVSYAPHVDIVAGGLHLHDITPGLIDLGLPGTQTKPPLVAVLGAEVFTQAAVDIDYAHHRLRFVAPSHAALADAVALPLGTFEGSFSLPVSIEAQAPVQILLDTGDNGTFQLFPAYWQAHDMLRARRFSIARSGGVGGFVDANTATLTSLGFGSIALHDVPSAFELPGVDTDNETGLLGNCGNALLSRFHVVVDFPAGKILIAAQPGSFAPFPHDLVGLQTIPDGQALKIFFVRPGSPAAKAGIVAGEQIIAINGQATKGEATGNDWQSSGSDRKVTLKFSNGISKTLIQARYD